MVKGLLHLLSVVKGLHTPNLPLATSGESLESHYGLFPLGCHFDGKIYSLEDTWHPDLGKPFGVAYCVLCRCEVVSYGLLELWWPSGSLLSYQVSLNTGIAIANILGMLVVWPLYLSSGFSIFELLTVNEYADQEN